MAGALCIIPARALQDERVKGSHLRALCAIGHYVNREQAAFAANQTYAAQAQLDPRHFRRALADLEAWGYVRRTPRPGRPNDVTICFDEPESHGGEGDICPPSRVENRPAGGRKLPALGAKTAPLSGSIGRAKAAQGGGRKLPTGEGENCPPNVLSNVLPIVNDGDSGAKNNTAIMPGTVSALLAAPARAVYDRLASTVGRTGGMAAIDYLLRLAAEGGEELASGKQVPPAGWPAVSAALVEWEASGGGRFTKIAFWGFLGRIVAPAPRQPRGSSSGGGLSGMAELSARLRAEGGADG